MKEAKEVIELKIDPEFRDKIPPLTDAEFEQLRENILADGEVYEPIVTWNSVIVDGHNRWRIIQENPQITFRTKEMDFADKWAAFEWMYKKQLGRRNLTEEQKSYMVGKMNEARKKSIGNTTSERGADGRFQSGQNVHNGQQRENKDGTSAEIGKEFGMSGRTVRRNEKFAKGVDALRGQSSEAAELVLMGKSNVTKDEIAELADKTEQEIAKAAKNIVDGKPVIRKPKPMSPQMKDFSKKLLDVVSEMENTNKAYTLDDAIRDLNSAEDVFINQIEFVLEERKEVIDSDKRGKEQVTAFIESVINDLNNLKGRFI